MLINIVLFVLKLFAGIVSGSVAVIASALDSLMDILTYSIAFFSLKISAKSPDMGHPFGHRNAQPISALIIAIASGIVSFEILKYGVERLVFGGEPLQLHPFVFGVLIFATIVKLLMFFYLNAKAKRTASTSIEALAVDSRNDVFSSTSALFGIVAVELGFPIFDSLVAILLGLFIFYFGFTLARKNLRYLMGASPDKEVVSEIKQLALKVDKVIKISEIKAYYMGDRINVELAIVLNKSLKPVETHAIGEEVQHEVERHALVSNVFVHIDYE